MPITWKNVNGNAGLANAANNSLRLAQQSFNSAARKAQGMLDTYYDAQQHKKDKALTSNNEAVKDYLAGFQSASDLQAAIDSGAVAKHLGQYDPEMVDRDLVRTGAKNRLESLYTEDQTRSERAYKPHGEEFGALVAQRNFEDATDYVTKHRDIFTNAGQYDEALGAIKQAQRNALVQSREDQGYNETRQNKQHTETAHNILDNVFGAPEAPANEATAYAMVDKLMDEKGIPASIQTDVLGKVASRWKGDFGLTQSDEEQLARDKADLDARTQTFVADIEAKYAPKIDSYRWKDTPFDAEKSVHVSDAFKTAVTEKGWRADKVKDHFNKGFTEAQKDANVGKFLQKLRKGSPEYAQIMARAADLLPYSQGHKDSEYRYLDWGEAAGKDYKSFKAAIIEAAQDYQVFLVDKTRYDSAVQSKNAELNNVLKSSLNAQKGQEKAARSRRKQIHEALNGKG